MVYNYLTYITKTARVTRFRKVKIMRSQTRFVESVILLRSESRDQLKQIAYWGIKIPVSVVSSTSVLPAPLLMISTV